MSKRVSVVVATYHREEPLREALASLAAQTYRDFEIVLADDNAEDERSEAVGRIVKQFKEEHPELPLLYIRNEENLGSAKTRNRAIEAAGGDYVTFLDDDDVYLPGKIERQLQFMLEGDLDFSVTDLSLYFDDGRLAEHKTRHYIKSTDPESLFVYHLKHHITGTDTMMFKREYLLGIGGFAPIDVGDEFYLMQRAIEGGGRFGYLPVSDVRAVIHTSDEGVSSGEGKIRGEHLLYKHKKKYWKALKRRDRRYIRMRHFAVLAFAEKRRGHTLAFLKWGILSALSSPIACVKMLKERG